MAQKYCKFSADVNGQRRSAHVWLEDGYQTLDDAELIVMNDRKAYDAFYAGATYEDYEAPLTARRLEVPQPPAILED